MNLLKKYIEEIILKSIHKLDFNMDPNANIIEKSNRPDLSDFQSNIAMHIAKKLKQNPKEIAEKIIDAANNFIEDENIKLTSVGGFINITVSNNFLSKSLDYFSLKQDIPEKKLKIFVDYGGPNIAKSLHVGHLRASIIGESLKNLARYMGHEVIGDIHLGDFGLPMGMIIASIKEQKIKLPISVNELNKIYPAASKRSKEDENFMNICQEETKKLQNKDPENVNIWKNFCDISINDIKKTLSILNIEFDLWKGESDTNDDVNYLVKYFNDKKFTSKSEGAEVIFLYNYPLHNNNVPPFIVLKSNGAIMYGMTDIATLYDRIKREKADYIWYVVDSRQELHFHQVFSVADLTGIKGKTELEHLGFGSVLGLDAKPLKTRDGDNVSLNELLDSTIAFAKEKILSNSKTNDLSKEEINKISNDIAIAAIKFADLINPRQNDYIFNIEKFVNFEGKTGSYVLYTAVRIKSILKELDINDDKLKEIIKFPIVINQKSERDLVLKILEFNEIIEKSFNTRAINILVQYIYELTVIINDFYHNCHIKGETNQNIYNSRLKLLYISLKIIEIFTNIIKINIPERM